MPVVGFKCSVFKKIKQFHLYENFIKTRYKLDIMYQLIQPLLKLPCSCYLYLPYLILASLSLISFYLFTIFCAKTCCCLTLVHQTDTNLRLLLFFFYVLKTCRQTATRCQKAAILHKIFVITAFKQGSIPGVVNILRHGMRQIIRKKNIQLS